MTLVNSLFTWYMKKRIHQIELFKKYPLDVQNEWLQSLISNAENTEWGKKYDYKSILTEKQFKERVPLQDYDTLKPYIQRMLKGEQNVLWPSEVKWFAKSSGTTSDRSKFIPVSEEALKECHFKGGKDMLSIYCNNQPSTEIFTGKSLALGGSRQVNQLCENIQYGDLSAVLIKNLPIWAEYYRTPNISIALMVNYEEKLAKMTKATAYENITSISGVPTWTVVLIKKILEYTGKSHVLEVWPNLEVYFHGAVNFAPYRQQFKELIPTSSMYYLETYNASEGFFGIQDQNNSEELLLMLDYGIYYEFLPIENIEDEQPQTLGLENVQLHKNYALIITTNAGLWRYMIGDTIQFTSVAPYRIKITGRTKHFINAFGEELIIDNAENGLKKACETTGALIKDYTAAPIYFKKQKAGGHEWIIEFEKQPHDFEKFVDVLDQTLREINSDYDAKRFKDLVLAKPLVHNAPQNTFYNWLKIKGKLGGQHKVPRLANNRDYLEDILKLITQTPYNQP